METKDPVRARHLNGVDAAFIYLERKELPLSIAAVCVFDGPISLKDFVRRVDSKLHLLPRFRQIVVAPPFNIGYPAWEDDPNFDIRDHIFRTKVDAPGGEAELEELAGRIFSGVMDRSKALWDFYVVDGLKDGRGALIVRMHHSLADGISGTAVLTTILDPTREGSLAMRKPRVRTPREAAPKPSLAGAVRVLSSAGARYP
jgi:diacylglycerol O-acyltransferase